MAKARTRSPVAVTSAQMVAACRLRWGESSALFEQVGNSTGYACNRHADVIAMGLWRSRGLYLEGVEIKVSRGDWLRELAKPDKADPIAEFCDYWWVAVSDENIVQEGELPERWGLLVLNGETLRCKKQAPKLEGQPLDRTFVAAILRRAAEAQDKIAREAKLEGYENGQKAKLEAFELTQPEHELKRLQDAVDAFEKASGIKITTWDGGELGEVVAKIRRLNGWRARRHDPKVLLERAADQLEERVKELRSEAKALNREMRLAAGVPLEELESEQLAEIGLRRGTRSATG